MNPLADTVALQSWKPVLTALVLPPLPFLLLLLLAALLLWRRRGLGWLITCLSLGGLWLSHCEVTANALQWVMHKPIAPLSDTRLTELRREVLAKKKLAIVVMGAGIEPYAPEYGMANLTALSLERLRYGLWLAKRIGAPLGYSGGIPWGGSFDDSNESAVASRIASTDFGRSLQWTEPHAKDTAESALRSIRLLREGGVQTVIVVTHGWHMPRALSEFELAAGGDMTLIPAPMGLGTHTRSAAMQWLPSQEGAIRVRLLLREALGGISGT